MQKNAKNNEKTIEYLFKVWYNKTVKGTKFQ